MHVGTNINPPRGYLAALSQVDDQRCTPYDRHHSAIGLVSCIKVLWRGESRQGWLKLKPY